MSAHIDMPEVKKATILCLSGQTISFEGIHVGEHKSYKEYHKREVFLLRYFFLLFDSVLRIESPEQFQVFESSFLPGVDLFFYPYRIEFKSGGNDFFMWIVIVADHEGKLFAFARTRPCEFGVMSKDLSNPELVWEKE